MQENGPDLEEHRRYLDAYGGGFVVNEGNGGEYKVNARKWTRLGRE